MNMKKRLGVRSRDVASFDFMVAPYKMAGTIVQRVFWCAMLFTMIPATKAQDDADYDADYELLCIDGGGRGNGQCSDALNNPLCRYDAGDCCSCTCDRSLVDNPEYDDTYTDLYQCGDGLFNCIDPSAPDFGRLLVYGCGAMPPIPPRCPFDGQSQWIVEDAAGASALANAVSNCSGGIFDVEWRGRAILNTTLWVVDGTSVTVSGGGDAVVDGGGLIRPFVVLNASLHLDGLAVVNGAADFGGGLFAGGSSLTLEGTNFSSNTADIGGAAYIDAGSSVSCFAVNEMSNNSAHTLNGGGLFVDGGSSVSWEAFRFHNQPNAVLVRGESTLYWSGDTTFIANNASALDVGGGSNVSWDGKTTFADGYDGTAVSVSGNSAVSWGGDTLFTNNNDGTALSVYDDNSTVSWSGNTVFTNNSETTCLNVWSGGHASWSGATSFENNFSDNNGIYKSPITMIGGSVSFSGRTLFLNNQASIAAGAINIAFGTLDWCGPTVFRNNSATNGGALEISDSNVSWSGQTVFDGNYASGDGGALFIDADSTVTWSGETTFAGNVAGVDGGAIGTKLEPDLSESASSLVVNGTTAFVGNSCGGSGGAIMISGALALAFDTEDVLFSGNAAQDNGGAVHVSNTAVGPVFFGLTFTGNTAKSGGAVFLTASGKEGIGQQTRYPTTFEFCNFADNVAELSGGAIDSSSGDDFIENSNFTGNKAVIGGALRLAGSDVWLNDCNFVANAAGTVGGGPAVLNVGSLSVYGSVFRRNYIECPPGSFVDSFESEGGRYATVCDGCPIADNSVIEGNTMGVENLVPTCTETLENTQSGGANTSIQDIRIDRGFWRATQTSDVILACYNPDACLGGMTGAADYCLEGYYGPYCAICTEGYGRTMAFECTKCSSGEGVAVGVIFFSALAVAGVALVRYLVSNERAGGGDRGFITRVKDKVSFRSLKTVIVVWQILTQFSDVANVTYPELYQRFLDVIDVLNFDVGWVLSAGCVVDFDFHDNFLASTIGPIIVLGVLGVTYAAASCRNRGSDEAIARVNRKHVSAVLLVTFLVYSSVSSTVFRMFVCDELDDGNAYLRADYSIDCKSTKHQALTVVAVIMVFLYPLGIPLFYAVLLHRIREVLQDGSSRQANPQAKTIASLWESYTPKRYKYEVIECARRMLLTGVVVFIYPKSAAQIAISLLMAFSFLIISEVLAPFASAWDCWVARCGHILVFVTMYVALLLKVDVSDEREDSQRLFAVILVVTNVMLFGAAVAEMVWMWRAIKLEENAMPRSRSARGVKGFGDFSLKGGSSEFPRVEPGCDESPAH